jgi:hypothetical protein
MKWALKTSRDISSGILKVNPPVEVPNRTEPYSIKYRKGLAETLQIFRRKSDAESAYRDETEAAEMTKLPDAELKKQMIDTIDYLKRAYRIPVEGVSSLIGIPYSTLRSYKEGHRISPRVVLRVIRLKEYLDDAAKKASSILPDAGSTGNPAMGRGGNPDIWRSRYKKQQTASG